MSEIEPVIEGEVVQVEAGPAEIEAREVVPKGTMTAMKAWLGAAAAYAGREVIVRLVDSLLDAWDRRSSGASVASSDPGTRAPSQRALGNLVADGQRGRRRRRRGG